ncbi:hypothetical protein L1887_26968 [Cichorium endivia]|nr:hypothetical protein L1887_26968 [Cichorium endivia]
MYECFGDEISNLHHIVVEAYLSKACNKHPQALLLSFGHSLALFEYNVKHIRLNGVVSPATTPHQLRLGVAMNFATKGDGKEWTYLFNALTRTYKYPIAQIPASHQAINKPN